MRASCGSRSWPEPKRRRRRRRSRLLGAGCWERALEGWRSAHRATQPHEHDRAPREHATHLLPGWGPRRAGRRRAAARPRPGPAPWSRCRAWGAARERESWRWASRLSPNCVSCASWPLADRPRWAAALRSGVEIRAGGRAGQKLERARAPPWRGVRGGHVPSCSPAVLIRRAPRRGTRTPHLWEHWLGAAWHTPTTQPPLDAAAGRAPLSQPPDWLPGSWAVVRSGRLGRTPPGLLRPGPGSHEQRGALPARQGAHGWRPER